MSTLTGANFNLVLGDLVVAQVLATNIKGSGIFSVPNIVGGLIQVIP